MGAKTINKSSGEQRRAARRRVDKKKSEYYQVFDGLQRARVPYVAIVQDQTGKILSVGINYEAAVKQLEKLGLQDQPYNIADFQVSC